MKFKKHKIINTLLATATLSAIVLIPFGVYSNNNNIESINDVQIEENVSSKNVELQGNSISQYSTSSPTETFYTHFGQEVGTEF